MNLWHFLCSNTSMHYRMIFFTWCVLMCSCGPTRAQGDADGVPVTFTVHAESVFFSRMADHRTSVGSGVGFGVDSGGLSSGIGLGVGFHGTQAYLLGGEHPGEAGAFRHALSWGDSTFTVPLRSGRRVVLTAQAQDGREGWETVGEFTVLSGSADKVQVVLDANGGTVIAY